MIRALCLFWVGLFLPIGAVGTAAAAGCQVSPRISVPLAMMRGVPTVQLHVDGQAARFVLDTGAARTTVALASVQRLGLRLDHWVGTTLQGVGGLQRHQNAVPRSVELGTVDLHQAGLGDGFSLAVATLPFAGGRDGAVDGLLGRDLLGSFDLDLDLSHRRVTLYAVANCRGDFLPWGVAHQGVSALPAYQGSMVFIGAVDGHPMRTIIDSGAGVSLLTASGSVRAGVSAASPGQDAAAHVAGVGPEKITARLHQFGSVSVAGVVTPAPTLLTTDVLLTPLVDLILGADWLNGHRVWLSFATRQVFVASH